jgi:hypothetical protein
MLQYATCIGVWRVVGLRGQLLEHADLLPSRASLREEQLIGLRIVQVLPSACIIPPPCCYAMDE